MFFHLSNSIKNNGYSSHLKFSNKECTNDCWNAYAGSSVSYKWNCSFEFKKNCGCRKDYIKIYWFENNQTYSKNVYIDKIMLIKSFLAFYIDLLLSIDYFIPHHLALKILRNLKFSTHSVSPKNSVWQIRLLVHISIVIYIIFYWEKIRMAQFLGTVSFSKFTRSFVFVLDLVFETR